MTINELISREDGLKLTKYMHVSGRVWPTLAGVSLYFVLGLSAYATDHAVSATGYPYSVTLTPHATTTAAQSVAGATVPASGGSNNGNFTVRWVCETVSTTKTPGYFVTRANISSTNIGGNPTLLLNSEIGIQYTTTPGGGITEYVPGTTSVGDVPGCHLTGETYLYPVTVTAKSFVIRTSIKGVVNFNAPNAFTVYMGSDDDLNTPLINYSISGSITAPSNCTIAPQTIPIQLGDIPSGAFLTGGVGNVPSGVTRKTVHIPVHCVGGDISTATISMRLSGSTATGHPEYLSTSNNRIGVNVVDESGTTLKPNNSGSTIPYHLDSNGSATITISAEPIFLGGGTPASGPFSATASLITTYP